MLPDHASRLGQMMAAPFRPGRVSWIGVRLARREPVNTLEAVDLVGGRGLIGDRYARRDGGRQVTLIQAEDLAAIASYLGRSVVSPADLRRNIVTAGVNLLALKGRRFRLGDAILEYSGECHPCWRMEETFGSGGYNAVRGRGGSSPPAASGSVTRYGASDASQSPNSSQRIRPSPGRWRQSSAGSPGASSA